MAAAVPMQSGFPVSTTAHHGATVTLTAMAAPPATHRLATLPTTSTTMKHNFTSQPTVTARPVVRNRKRSRAGAHGRVAQCLDSKGHEALMSLERRLKGMRLAHPHPATRPHRPVHLASINASSKHPAEARAAEGTQSTLYKHGTVPQMPHRPQAPKALPEAVPAARRPRFMKPLVAKDNAPTVPLTPSRPNQPNPRMAAGFASPRRPVSASMPTRRPAPSILKRRRRTKSATTRKTTVAAKDDFVPDGMIVSLPPLLPTHSLLADAYTQGYDCNVNDADIDAIGEVDTDTELDMDLAGSLTGAGGAIPASAAPATPSRAGRPSVVVPSTFVQDMLISLDDSLEEGGFQELLREARRCTLPSGTDTAGAGAPVLTPGSAPVVTEEALPLNDSPTLIFDALSPNVWNSTSDGSLRSPGMFDSLPSFDGTAFSFADLGMDDTRL